MAFVNKYKIPFVDNQGNSCTIYFLKDGYSGSVIELTPSVNPCILTYNGNVNNKLDPIITSDLSIGFINTTGANYSEFYSAEETSFRIELYKDKGAGDVLEWKGILIPDSYQELLQYQPTEIRLSAVCGLSRLKFYNYQIEDFDLGTTYISKYMGVKRIAVLLSEIFSKADMGVLDMANFYSFFEFAGFSANPLTDPENNSFEHRYYIDSALAYDNNGKALTYYDILVEICKFQQARCFQYKGEYYIISIPLYTATSIGVSQSFATRVEANQGTVETPNCGSNYVDEFYTQYLPLNTNDITNGNWIEFNNIPIEKKYKQDYIYALKDQLITYQPGIRNAQVTSKIERGGPLVNNPSFDTWLSTLDAPEGWIDQTGGLINRIEYDNDITNTNYANQGSLISLGLNASDFAVGPPTAGDDATLIKTIPTIVSNNQKFRIRFWINYNEAIDGGTNIQIPFYVKVGNYYAQPQVGGTSWITTPYFYNQTINNINYTTSTWFELNFPSSNGFFTNVNLGSNDFVGGLEIGFYLPYLTGGGLTTPGQLKIDDVQLITPESLGIYDPDRGRYEAANEYGMFAFNNDAITGKIKYTDFDYLSNTIIDKNNNNDITLSLSVFKPSYIRRYFYTDGGSKAFLFPNDYPAGSLVVQDNTLIYNHDGNFARVSNQSEFLGLDGFGFYPLFMQDLFKLYEKTMQVFSGTLYPYTNETEFSIINTFRDSITNNGIILLPAKLEIDYKNNFTRLEAFEIDGLDKVIGTIEIPTGNYIPPGDPDSGVEE